VRWLPPIDGTALIATLGVIKAHYTSYPNAPAPADSNANPPVQDLTGERLAITPRYSATLIPSYTLATPFLGGPTTFAVDYIYRSGRFTDVDLDPRTYQEATHELNARVTFADEIGRWRVTLGARNLTDEVVLEQVLDEPLAPGNFGATRSDRGRYYSAVVTLAWPAP
jgi:iron complex outermembrane recepter protein